MGENLWRKTHPEEYREYQRKYAREYRKRQKEAPTKKTRGPNKARLTTALEVCKMEWNPRITEHGKDYDHPKAIEYD